MRKLLLLLLQVQKKKKRDYEHIKPAYLCGLEAVSVTYVGNNLNHSSSITLSNYKYCLSFSRAMAFETCERNAEFALYIYRKVVSAAA